MPNLTGPLVVALAYDGLCTFEFGIVAEVFGLERPEMGQNWYRFQSCAIEQGPLRAHGGFTFQPDSGLEVLSDADLIVVPGWKGAEAGVPEGVLDCLRQAHGRGARLASICSGAFVLAATGLLDGKVATTHWRYADALRQKHPLIDVDEKSLYRIEAGLFTSAGSAAGIDLMIEIVRRDFGPAAANSVARRIVMPAHRSGGQAQYLERPVQDPRNNSIAALLDRMRQDIRGAWTIEKMADMSNMSRRTFERRFSEATGITPAGWLNQERTQQAQRLLIDTALSIEDIADHVGFTDGHALRHHFRKLVRQTPHQYRKEFSV